jgi:hypothetical protein
MSTRKANGVECAETARRQIPPSTWELEARAAVDAGIMLRRVALTLPDDSGLRRTLLERAQGYIMGAALRGIENRPVEAQLRAEIAAADRIAAERVLAVAA